MKKKDVIVVMANDFARKNMWDDSYRPEQIFTRDYIGEYYPELKVKLEYRVSNLTLDGKPYRGSVLDIAIPEKMIGIRLNGGYHHVSSRQQLKDELQKEALKQAGWTIVDFNDYKMPNLFKGKYSDKNIKLVENEIKDTLSDIIG